MWGVSFLPVFTFTAHFLLDWTLPHPNILKFLSENTRSIVRGLSSCTFATQDFIQTWSHSAGFRSFHVTLPTSQS